MKLIILAAGATNTADSTADEPPKCLRRFDPQTTILDRIVAAGSAAGCDQVAVVGGYRILSIMQQYPRFKYYFNPQWEKTGSLASLVQAEPELTRDALVVYSDVVFDPQRTAALAAAPGDLIVATDSRWATRYEGRTAAVLAEAEKLYRAPDGRLRVTREPLDRSPWDLLGEFAGAFVLRAGQAAPAMELARTILADTPAAGIDRLITALSAELPPGRSQVVDFEGAWAELDSEQDLARFRFGTKAETLKRLQGQLTSARILPQYSFSVGAWRDDPAAVCTAIAAAFPDTSVVVRSSALNEDTEHASLAGSYTSILDVHAPDPEALSRAIDQVCTSYRSPEAEERQNQVLVQPMLQGVLLSGVAFTADLETGAPYYLINYDTSGSTESVTAGSSGEHRTVIVHKHGDVQPRDAALAAVVRALREIETRTGYTSLDVEFAVCGPEPEVTIFQVRPIAAHKDQLRVSAADIHHELSHVIAFLQADARDRTTLSGSRTVWGVMPDWNPAEIIGINPRPLAFSLYRAIITDEIWGRSREECGYRPTRPRPGIVSLAGKPYVDVRMSFTSFTPAAVPMQLAHRLVDAALAHLAGNPALHDKVEFAVMPTAFDLDFSARLAPLLDYDRFTPEEQTVLTDAYRDLTVRIVAGQGISVERELQRIARLKPLREAILESVRAGETALPAAVAALLDQCREYGTLPFSNLARFAFVGIIQLRALVARRLLDPQRMNQFLASIETVAKEFVHDLAAAEREDLIRQYGHLRPGTYDITSPAYHEAFDQYVDLSRRPAAEPLVPFLLAPQEEALINRELDAAGFTAPDGTQIDSTALFSFIRGAVQGRERGKFEFTRNLSAALDLVVQIAEGEGLSRDEASYLVLPDILALSGASRPAGLAAHWRDAVQRRRRRHLITGAVRLPPVITALEDVQCFTVTDEQPNFITRQVVQGQPRRVHGIDTAIDGRIVLIENADPGFDWLFSHPIAALVTRFGGANSHMAIRCAEFEIPAAIGCGEAIFHRLEQAQLVRMDCSNRTIEVIR